jgi:hypothetical protein
MSNGKLGIFGSRYLMDVSDSSGPDMLPVGDLGVASCHPDILLVHGDATLTDVSEIVVVIESEINHAHSCS